MMAHLRDDPVAIMDVGVARPGQGWSDATGGVPRMPDLKHGHDWTGDVKESGVLTWPI
jgi:hypothetical protein